MGSSSSRSVGGEHALRRDASAVADRHAAARRSSFRPHPESVSIPELMQSGSGMPSHSLNSSNRGDRSGEGQGSGNSGGSGNRGESSSEPGPLPRGGNTSSSASLRFPYHGQTETASPTHGGVPSPTLMEFDSSGSGQAGSSHSPVYLSAPLHRSRIGSSGGIHEEDPQELPSGGGSRQSLDDERLHAACETTLRRHRVNEMQERLRRCAGFPPSLDLHELERRGFMTSDAAEAQHRMEVMSGTVNQGLFTPRGSERDAYDMSPWAAPSLLQAWDHPGIWEGGYVGPTSTVASSGRASPPLGENSGVQRGHSSGREGRRTSGRRLWDALSRATSHRRSSAATVAATSDDNEDVFPTDDVDHMVEVGSLHGSRALDLDERRRRVRSQVWALRRLSNGLEGVPWHSRTCSGNHHGHRCSCDAHGMGEDSNTRASISRIIMLAEALFEVLDEIHRQSVALSRSATVSRASLPAPSPVVDAMPIRIHSSKPAAVCEETTQCYICLVEYGEGDPIRILPCQHEYHKGCVDKWLKEVHRVCPLCRGDVCDAKALGTGHQASV